MIDFYTWKKPFFVPENTDIVLPELNPLTTYIDPMGVLGLTMFFGMLFCLFLFIRKKLPVIGWPASLLWFYALANALFILEFPDTPYGLYNRAYEANAGRSFAEMLLIPLAAMAAPKWIWKVFIAGVVFDIGLVWCGQSAFTAWDFVSTSFDTAFMAIMIPFSPMWLIPLSLLTILTHHGSTAFLILLMNILAWCYVRARPWPLRKKVLAWTGFAIAAGLLFALAYFHSNAPMLDGEERLHIWTKYSAFPSRSWNFQWLGVGAGSFVWISELMDKFGPNNFVWMLNDWLQTKFDMGWIGLGLMVGVFLNCIWNVRKHYQLLAAVLGCGAFMCTYYPLRLFPTMLLFALIANLALNKKAQGFPQAL